MPYVETHLEMHGTTAQAFAVARNLENFPNIMRDIERVTIVEDHGSWAISEWESDVDGTVIEWTERDDFDMATPKITYKLIEGDLDTFEGEWRFEEIKPGTVRVTLTVNYDFGIPELAKLMGETLDIKVRENSLMMLEGIKQQLEQISH